MSANAVVALVVFGVFVQFSHLVWLAQLRNCCNTEYGFLTLKLNCFDSFNDAFPNITMFHWMKIQIGNVTLDFSVGLPKEAKQNVQPFPRSWLANGWFVYMMFEVVLIIRQLSLQNQETIFSVQCSNSILAFRPGTCLLQDNKFPLLLGINKVWI